MSETCLKSSGGDKGGGFVYNTGGASRSVHGKRMKALFESDGGWRHCHYHEIVSAVMLRNSQVLGVNE